MLVSLTVGKVDAGVTVLLTPDKRLVCIIAPNHHNSKLTAVSPIADRIPLHPPAP